MRVGIWLTALLCVLAQEETHLPDGKTLRGFIESPAGGQLRYYFEVLSEPLPGEDLSLTLTTFSDAVHPSMYLSRDSLPTAASHDWESSGWGSGAIVLQTSEIKVNSTYHVLVSCFSHCRYTLTLAHLMVVTLTDGVPVSGYVQADHTNMYSFDTGEQTIKELVVTLTPLGLSPQYTLYVENKALGNSYLVTESWHMGKQCVISPLLPDSHLNITVSSHESFNYTLIAASSAAERVLQASVPTAGSLSTGQAALYVLNVTSPEETLIVQLTTYVGEVDMFVRANSPPAPGISDFHTTAHGNETISIDKHQRSDLGKPTGPYYIRLQAVSHAVYTITATEDRNSFVPLFSGIPQVGYADHKEVDLYYMDVPPQQDLNITFRVTAIYGNPDLYARICNLPDQSQCLFSSDMIKNPDNYNISCSKHKTGDEVVAISHAANLCAEQRCRYVVAVSGKSQERTRFSISGDYDDSTEYRLMEGVPVKLTLRPGNYSYFKYTVFNETVGNLTFLLTPISGDPDLYITRESAPKPSNIFNEKSSVKSMAQIDSVTYVKGEDGASLVATYHIAVYSYLLTTFSLVAREYIPGRNATIWLYSGQSQQDVLFNDTDNDYRLYAFYVHYTEETKQPIRVSLTPLSGNFTLYVANRLENLDWSKGIFYYDWMSNDTSASQQAVSININPDDRFYRMQSTYLVLVQATGFNNDKTASYVVTYSSGEGLISLQEGVPFPDEVAEKAYRYYAFPIHYDHEDITITVSALSGDPDLYVSLRVNNSKPTKESYDKRSTNFGGEVMSLEWEEGLQDLCPDLPETYHFGDPLHCLMHIAVYGYKAAIYTITVTARKDVPTLLTAEAPAIGQLEKSRYRFYYSQVRNSLPLTVTLQSLSGDSDLFLNLFDYTNTGASDITSLPRPNQLQYDHMSRSAAMVDRIDLSPAHLTDTCKSGTCLAIMGVYCFSNYTCSYSLTVSQEEAELLTEGQPRANSLNSMNYAYYSFYNSKDNTTLLISLTAMSGDPDLYVARNKTSRPTSEEYDWASRGWKGENLYIHFNDTQFFGKSMRGYYIIGVKAVTNCTYTLSVTSDPDQVLSIPGGVPTYGSVRPFGAVYYEYYHPNASSFSVKMTPLQGQALLKVAKSLDSEAFPTVTDFKWTSETSGVPNSIFISSTDLEFCSHCTYILGVFGQSANCSFILTVAMSGDTVMLMNGVPLQDHVADSSWKYYSFYSPSDSDIDVSLTNYAGDADIYVSTTDEVSATSYNWTHASHKHIEHVHIPKSKQDPNQRMYLVGVFGEKNTSYSITFHSRDSAITLVEGWPHTYTIMLRHSDHLYFDYQYRDWEEMTKCLVRPLSKDFWPSVAVLFTNNKAEFPKLGEGYLDSSAQNYDFLYRTLTFDLPKQEKAGFYRIGVFGASVHGLSREELGAFEVSCTGQSNYAILRPGGITFGTLPTNADSQQFRIFVPEKGTLEAILVPCHSHTSLSVSSNFTLSSSEDADITITRPTDGRIVANIGNAQGQYYVTVTATRPEARGSNFELTVLTVPKGKRPPAKAVAGNDGLLTWTVHRRNNIALNWSPLEYESGDPVTSEVDYFVFASRSLTDKINTVCTIRSSMAAGETWIAGHVGVNDSIPAHFELPVNQQVLVNVVARMQTEENALLTSVVYEPTEVLLRGRLSNRKVGLVVIGVVTVCLVLALVALFLVYKKYRRVKKQLEHEMMDIGKVASISSDRLDPDSLWDDAQKRGMAYIPFQIADSA